jgi:phage gp29-like protein
MGFQVAQWELFDLMIDTWPELGTCIQELTYGVERKQMVVEPFIVDGEKPDPEAVERSKFVSRALHLMDPNPATDENDLRGTISDLTDAWFRGLTVLEVFWYQVEGTAKDESISWCPRATQWVHPKNYAYDQNYVLGLRNEAYTSTTSVQAVPDNMIRFPPYKFMIGQHKAKSGPALGCALLRPLAWWWCAANFSADWLLNLGQLFGIPWRIAKYDPNAPSETLAAIDAMLQNMGSSTWARFPVGTDIELVQPTKEGSDHSPQGELMDRADRYARSLILGQTMSGTHGTTGKGGGQAFGVVERNVKEDRVDAAGKFVASVINQQLIKYILKLNYGDIQNAPYLRFLEEEEGGLQEAQRDQVLQKMGQPMSEEWISDKYGVPLPADDETLLQAPVAAPSSGSFGQQSSRGKNPQDTQDVEDAADTEQQPAEARLEKLLAIEDDAVFARELNKLAEEISK